MSMPFGGLLCSTYERPRQAPRFAAAQTASPTRKPTNPPCPLLWFHHERHRCHRFTPRIRRDI
ncbi:uncharacterized protein TRAVEDRAFT_26701, partial [Trametes versicolor FP-101664 SS1]|uniref:uncharacterized protein n=1 Tax=Trametes versicolor (strain FP-101664) TaxID=717944 RepID=UPI000462336C